MRNISHIIEIKNLISYFIKKILNLLVKKTKKKGIEPLSSSFGN